MGIKQLEASQISRFAYVRALDEVFPRLWPPFSTWVSAALDNSFSQADSHDRHTFLRMVGVALEVLAKVSPSGRGFVNWNEEISFHARLWLRIGPSAKEAQLSYIIFQRRMAVIERLSCDPILNAALHYNMELSDVLRVATARLQRCILRLSPLSSSGSMVQQPFAVVQRVCDASSGTLFIIYCLLHASAGDRGGMAIPRSLEFRRTFRTISSTVLRLLDTLLSLAEGKNSGLEGAADDCFTVIAGLLDMIPDPSFVCLALRKGLVASIVRALTLDLGPVGPRVGESRALKALLSNILPRNLLFHSVITSAKRAMQAVIRLEGDGIHADSPFGKEWSVFRNLVDHSSCAVRFLKMRRHEEEASCGNVSSFISLRS